MNMKKKVLFYFHGYGSNKNTDKVRRLKVMGYETYAFDIDVDPSVSIPKLSQEITYWLIDNIAREDIEIVFIGTSLGAWYATKLGEQFLAQTISINPCIRPWKSLEKYNVPKHILDKYNTLYFDEELDTVVIAEDDELFDFSQEFVLIDAKKVIYSKTGGHRFNGPEFEEYIGKILESNS